LSIMALFGTHFEVLTLFRLLLYSQNLAVILLASFPDCCIL